MFFLNASGPEKFKVKLVGWSPGQPGPVCAWNFNMAGVCVVVVGVGGGGGGQPGCVCVCVSVATLAQAGFLAGRSRSSAELVARPAFLRVSSPVAQWR